MARICTILATRRSGTVLAHRLPPPAARASGVGSIYGGIGTTHSRKVGHCRDVDVACQRPGAKAPRPSQSPCRNGAVGE